jgi:16S rRNA (uracil1498-N3)-methyltransferase
VLELLGEADLAVVLHETASLPLAALQLEDVERIVVVVGPEGGLTDDELEAFVEVGGEVVRLGSSVLRTSTAGVVAATALLSRTPRWS